MIKKNNEAIEIKTNAEQREYERISGCVEKVSDGNSKFFYACLILLNIITIIICYLVLNKVFPIEKFSVVFESIDIKIWLLLLLSFILILFLDTLPMFLKVYNKTKNKNFGNSLTATIKTEYFDRVTVCGSGKIPMSVNYLMSKGHSQKNVVDINYGIKLFDKISFLIYAFVIFVVGSFIWLENINIWLFVVGLVCLLILFVQIITILMFNNNKKKTLEVLSSIVQFLYNLHLIKDYEKVYYKWIDKLIIYSKELKQNKLLSLAEILLNIFKYFLKTLVLYFIIVTINFSSVSIVGNLLLATVILDLILKFWPIRYGTFLYEILFVFLFKNLFFEGYVFWGLLIYRIFDYFLYAIVYYIWEIFGIVKRKVVAKKSIKKQ